MKVSDLFQGIGSSIAFYPDLVPIVGSHHAAIFLCQLCYWTGKQHNPQGWIYKTQEDWQLETELSPKEQKTARTLLVNKGFMEERFVGIPRRLEYRVLLNALDTLWDSWVPAMRIKFWLRNKLKEEATLISRGLADEKLEKVITVLREGLTQARRTPENAGSIEKSIIDQMEIIEKTTLYPYLTDGRFKERPEVDTGTDQGKILGATSGGFLLYTENTQETSPKNTHSPLPPAGGKESVEEKEQPKNGGRPPAPNINSLASQEAIGDIKQSTVIREDSFSGAAVATINYAALGMQDPNDRKTRQMREFNWVPDGPWKVDNKLDNNFVDWLTAKWVRDFGRDVHSTRANVQRHLKKDAANFAIAWDEYHREHLHRFSNAAVRERSGGVLSPEEQQKLLQHSAAVTQAVPEELASVAYTLPSAVEEFTPDIAAKLNGNGSAPSLPQGAENPDCYQIYKPAESVADISPEEAAANIKKLREMMQSMGGKRVMPKIEPSKPKSVVEDLMTDLEDPGIRFSVDVQARAQRLVGTDDGWCADYNEQGKIVAIYRF